MENKIQCFSCDTWITVEDKIKEGIVVKCPQCGMEYACIDANKYITRWVCKEDYNERN